MRRLLEDLYGPRPSESDTAYSSPDDAAAAYAGTFAFFADLNAWAIDEISQHGAWSFVLKNPPDKLVHNFKRSDTHSTLVHDLYLGAWELS